MRIVQVFGAGAVNVSPRIGHLHVTVDDLPWWWADASDNNTVDIANFPPGEHKVKPRLEHRSALTVFCLLRSAADRLVETHFHWAAGTG